MNNNYERLDVTMHQVLTVNPLPQPKVFMCSQIKIFLLWSLAYFLVVITASAQKQLQDCYILEKSWNNNYALPSSSYEPYGMAVDASNHVYVADGSHIIIYDMNGTTLQTWPVASARDVVLHPTSNLVFVSTTTTTNQIKVFDTNGTFIRQWGGSGSGVGQFGATGHSTISVSSSGLVYVADELNSRIQVFDVNGIYLAQWGGYGSVAGQFIYPYDISVGIDGNINVADAGNSRIQQFQPNGTFVGQNPVAGDITIDNCII